MGTEDRGAPLPPPLDGRRPMAARSDAAAPSFGAASSPSGSRFARARAPSSFAAFFAARTDAAAAPRLAFFGGLAASAASALAAAASS